MEHYGSGLCPEWENVGSEIIYVWNLIQGFFKARVICHHVIKTVEKAIPLTEGYSSFQLLSQELIDKHRQHYTFLHLGMIQVGVAF